MIDGKDGMGWAADTVERLRHAGQTYLPRTTAYGIYDHRLVMAWQRAEEGVDRLWQIRARHIVLAAGAIERPLVFPDNDRPGIMSAEAALAYLALHDVLVGRRIVLAAANTVTLAAADRLRAAGAKVTVADLRDGTTLDAVHGKRRVEAVTLSGRKVDADCLLVSGGFTPSVHLHCQAGGKLRYDEEIAAFVPADQVEGLAVTGAAAGQFDLAAALQSGHAIGGGAGRIPQAGAEAAAYAVTPSWPRPASPGRQWIDYQNDVTLKDIELAARENFRSVEHLKRYTTLGMATDQGKTSNMNGLAAMAAVTGNSIPQTGTTTYRPPFVPVPFTVVAGRRRAHLFNPVRRLELEDEHKRLGAVFREYGGWLRPAWYGAGRAGDEIAREARMARETVGILDGSPLGKIEVMGPGAGALVDFNSYNRLSNLAPGRFRYGFMLTEAGIVYDDGVTAKLSDDHYLISCSSGHVAGVAMRLEEFRQDRFDPARVFVHNSTPHWATLTATGPASRDIVAALGLGVELADDALPHMSLRDCTFDGTVARIARVSFTGDRSYEVSVPQSKAAALYRAMLEAARRVRGGPLGSEALLLLRAEKGYIIAGKDTDGTTMPQDLGITGPRDKRADEFVGKRSLSTENALRSDRLQTVGLTVPDGADALPTGAHIVEEAAGRRRSAGFVTSSYVSPLLGRPIALALVERGLSRIGEEVQLFHLGRRLSARIAPACALDPDGSRLNG
jgi:sarcosine oxidase, subunit alpha